MQNVFKRRTVKKHISPVAVILLVLLVLYALMLIGLLFWAFMTSFKSQQEFRLNVIGFPKTWVWNYTFVFQMYLYPVFTEAGTEYVGMGLMFLYSLLYAAGCAFTATLVPCITSYLCARFPYKFGKIVYLIVIVTMVIPIVGNQPSEIQVAQFFGLYDQIWGLWLMKANFLGMYFLVFFAIFFMVAGDRTGMALSLNSTRIFPISADCSCGRHSVRNNRISPLFMLCIQYKSGTFTQGDTVDGNILSNPVKW